MFVITYGRSGSTVLQALLNTIPGWCIRGENAGALTHLCRAVDGLRENPARAQGREVPDDPWFGFAGIKIDAVARALFEVFCREILRLPPGTRVGGFKEIRYVEDAAFLPIQLALMEEFFPKARFVFLTRNHSEVARSGWWGQWPAEEVAADLAAADAAFAEFGKGRANCFTLDHADLIPDSDRLQALFDFLGESYSSSRVGAVLHRRLSHGVLSG